MKPSPSSIRASAILVALLLTSLCAQAFYNSELGRWLSRDPLEDAEISDESPNLYSFLGNIPIGSVDSDGRKKISCDDIQKLIKDNNACGQVDAALLTCLFYRESTFDPDAVNKSTGATGLGQMTDVAAADVGCSGADLSDPATNVKCTSKYLCLLLKATKGNFDNALKRYSGDKSGKYGNAVKNCAQCLRSNKSGAGAANNPCDQACLAQAKKNPTP